MLKHVAVSPHRARADSVSLSSSASCCSLGSLEHRHDSVADLSHRTTHGEFTLGAKRTRRGKVVLYADSTYQLSHGKQGLFHMCGHNKYYQS
ncbi:unnamed protein product [Parnassius apollo]|uniref:(apollo) hypothetical protein n=1 Tax=Parnassius apollo TaxID=110799 RepID=A0A8S3WU32_PARAO|nr:unnamed protein product [Parnassius apollo]